MKLCKYLILLVAGLFLFVRTSPNASARPNYKKGFANYCRTEFAGRREANQSDVCHDAKNYSLQNVYGQALAESLEVKHESDVTRLEAALRATENKPSGIDGLTFGDLIKVGRLPASK